MLRRGELLGLLCLCREADEWRAVLCSLGGKLRLLCLPLFALLIQFESVMGDEATGHQGQTTTSEEADQEKDMSFLILFFYSWLIVSQEGQHTPGEAEEQKNTSSRPTSPRNEEEKEIKRRKAIKRNKLRKRKKARSKKQIKDKIKKRVPGNGQYSSEQPNKGDKLRKVKVEVEDKIKKVGQHPSDRSGVDKFRVKFRVQKDKTKGQKVQVVKKEELPECSYQREGKGKGKEVLGKGKEVLVVKKEELPECSYQKEGKGKGKEGKGKGKEVLGKGMEVLVVKKEELPESSMRSSIQEDLPECPPLKNGKGKKKPHAYHNKKKREED